MLKLRSHDAIDLTDSFVFTPGHCVNFRMMRYESTGFNRIIVDKSRPGLRMLLAVWNKVNCKFFSQGVAIVRPQYTECHHPV